MKTSLSVSKDVEFYKFNPEMKNLIRLSAQFSFRNILKAR